MGQTGLPAKKWLVPLLVILIIILVIETTLLVVILVQSYAGGSATFPGLVIRNVQPNCQTLVPTTESTTATNRTVLFQCPGSGQSSYALTTSTWPPYQFSWEPTHFYPIFGAIPTFTLPRGYLSLSLIYVGCPPTTNTFSAPLKSGEEIAIGGETYLYDYCAVIDNSVINIGSFTIDWSAGTRPIIEPAPFTLTASPTTETVPFGGTANFTFTVTSLGGWAGNVSVVLYGGYDLGLSYQWNYSSVSLRPGGSNVTTFRQPTCNGNRTYCTPVGSHTITVAAYTGCRVGGSVYSQGECLDSYKRVYLNLTINVA